MRSFGTKAYSQRTNRTKTSTRKKNLRLRERTLSTLTLASTMKKEGSCLSLRKEVVSQPRKPGSEAKWRTLKKRKTGSSLLKRGKSTKRRKLPSEMH